jgi:hypothetical protein
MELSQENSLCSYLTSNKQKYYFSLYLFSSPKSKNGRAEQILPRGSGWPE